jgi:hypothetical protein
MALREGLGPPPPQQTFVRWNDPHGTELIGLNRDGTIYSFGLQFPNGSSIDDSGNITTQGVITADEYTFGGNTIYLGTYTGIADVQQTGIGLFDVNGNSFQTQRVNGNNEVSIFLLPQFNDTVNYVGPFLDASSNGTAAGSVFSLSDGFNALLVLGQNDGVNFLLSNMIVVDNVPTNYTAGIRNKTGSIMYAYGDPLILGQSYYSTSINSITVSSAIGTSVSGPAILATTHTPTSSSAAGITGQIAWDQSYFYVCLNGSTPLWGRAALTSTGW